MRHRSSTSAALASPLLIGAVTLLIALVAVFLAYNANKGLPFVATTTVEAEVPDAAELVEGNEVRVGGTLSGQVAQITAIDRPGRQQPIARLELRLDPGVEVRSDAQVEIRQRSNLGLKYVQLTPGDRGRVLEDGDRLPLSRAEDPTSLEEALNAFDAPTRRGYRGTMKELAAAFAGRGPDLNRTIAELPVLLERIQPVFNGLASPETDLPGFIRGLESGMEALRPPTAQRLVGTFDAGARTFGALADERTAVRAFIDEVPRLEAQGTPALREVRPLLAETATLLRDLRPGARALPAGARALTASFRASGPTLQRARRLAVDLEPTLRAVSGYARRPTTRPALRATSGALAPVGPLLEQVNPFQTRCNYLGVWTRNTTSLLSEGDQLGTWFRILSVGKLDEQLQRPTPAPDLKRNDYPVTGQDGQCEAGNEPFAANEQVIGNPPSVEPGSTDDTSPQTFGLERGRTIPERER